MTDKAMTKKETEQALSQVEDVFEESAGLGYEETDQDTYALPMMSILQKGSPQVDEALGNPVPGAKAGMFWDNIQEECFPGDPGLTVIPVHFRRSVIEWIPRTDGGGFVGEMTPEQAEQILGKAITARDIRDDKNRIVVPETGHELVDTRSHYLLVERDGEFLPVLVSMTSTQLKKSRRWMTAMGQITRQRKNKTRYRPPMFSNVYQLTTVPEKNDQGSWFGFKITRKGFVDELYTPEVALEALEAAKAFREMLKSGQIEERREQTTDEVEIDDEVGF